MRHCHQAATAGLVARIGCHNRIRSVGAGRRILAPPEAASATQSIFDPCLIVSDAPGVNFSVRPGSREGRPVALTIRCHAGRS
jgi:hypothetical protein